MLIYLVAFFHNNFITFLWRFLLHVFVYILKFITEPSMHFQVLFVRGISRIRPSGSGWTCSTVKNLQGWRWQSLQNLEPRNRFRQAGNWFLCSLKGLYKYGLRSTTCCKKQGWPEPYYYLRIKIQIFQKASKSVGSGSNALFCSKMWNRLWILSHFRQLWTA